MDFSQFLANFVPRVARKSKQVNQAFWLLETTGSADAADLKGTLDSELKLVFNNPEIYQELLELEKTGRVKDPLLQRQLNVLLRTFKQNQISESLLEEISQREAALAMAYGKFRPLLKGKQASENDLREILKNEQNVPVRKEAWEASKQIGRELAPQILALVRLRNQAAHSLGYSDYFQMQLDLQEIDGPWLLKTFDDLSQRSNAAYLEVLEEIEQAQIAQFHVEVKELGPWAWGEPFCQEDPLDSHELDQLVEGVDFSQSAAAFYTRMGIDVDPILQHSDMYERPGKNQHAFCINMDREEDIRTLNNVNSTIKWLETVLHELGHAIYEMGFEPHLPWLLKEPPHMITTEAMALIAGRKAYTADSLRRLVGEKPKALLQLADRSLKRRQLIFSRWVLVMTAFESELYRNPDQDLNTLWWHLVEKYQKIRAPKDRSGKWDWAAKYHIGLAPAYYYSYLLGEMFASAIEETLVKECQASLESPQAGKLLNKKLFGPGNRMPWNDLVHHVTGDFLTPDAWIREFASVRELDLR